jgi:hypothetical protein
VKSHAWDRNLGGRDFDEVLFDHFCAEFMEKFKLDVRPNAKACFKLRLALEKVRSITPCGAPVGGGQGETCGTGPSDWPTLALSATGAAGAAAAAAASYSSTSSTSRSMLQQHQQQHQQHFTPA